MEFIGPQGNGDNNLLKGSWTFLNYKQENEEELFKSGSFDIAIPLFGHANSNSEPNSISNIARILFCKQDTEGNVTGFVKTKTTGKGGAIFCKDVTKSWYFGVIWGKHYGVTFAVKPEAILNKEIVGKTLSANDVQNINGKSLLNQELVKILEEAAGPGKDFMGKAKNQNNKKYVDCRDLKEDDRGRKNCFLWGTKFSKTDYSEKEENCGDASAEVNGCNIGIIDVSRCAGGAETSNPVK